MERNQPKGIIKLIFLFSLLSVFITSCEMDEFDLLDPSTAGTWEMITTSDGIAGNDIRDVFLDSRGDLWVACYGSGISKFDGSAWTTFNTSNSGLLSNDVRCIGEDGDGDMWFGLSDGISFLVDGYEWQYFFDIDRQYRVNTFKLASNGWMWAGCDGGGYIVYDGSGLYTSTLSTIVEHNVINCIEEDDGGNVWLATDDGVLIWNGSSWSWQSVEYGLGTDVVWSLLNDSKGRMWIGTQGGYTVVYSKDFTLIPVSILNGGYDVYIKDIFEDRRGDIWFATWFDGLVRYDGVVSEAFKEYNGFPDDYVETVAADSNGNILAGTSSGLALYHLAITVK